MSTFRDLYPSFVDNFGRSIYVDDVSLGSTDVSGAYELYLKSKPCLADAGFKLRKFASELRHLIDINENNVVRSVDNLSVMEDDQSYSKGSLGTKGGNQVHKLLGAQWDFIKDVLICDINDVIEIITRSRPTKRAVVSMTCRIFDPLGIVSPVAIMFKTFFQDLCRSKIEWDEALTGGALKLARQHWIRELQSHLTTHDKFNIWHNLFLDENQIWRCNGRMLKSSLPFLAKTPVLLDKKHHLT